MTKEKIVEEPRNGENLLVEVLKSVGISAFVAVISVLLKRSWRAS